MTNSKKIFALSDLLVFITIVIMAIIVYLLVKFSEGYSNNSQFIDHRKEYDSLFYENRKHVFHELNICDSCSEYDSIISAVVANQLTIIKRQDDLINDIRQETNNNLDKTSSLISFWIGIIALLGVFVPLILQFRLYYIDKSLIHDMENKMNDEQIRLENHLCMSELNSFSVIAENILLQETSDLNNVLIQLWNQSNNNLEKMIEFCFKDKQNECDKYRIELINSLIHVLIALSRIRRLKCNRFRDIESVSDGIRKIIIDIADRNYDDWNALHDKMKMIIKKLRVIRFSEKS